MDQPITPVESKPAETDADASWHTYLESEPVKESPKPPKRKKIQTKRAFGGTRYN